MLFLDSPYFNRQERLARLAAFLLGTAADHQPDKRQLHETLFGQEAAFRQQAVYDALSQLGKLLERFLATQAFEAEDAVRQRYLLAALARQQQEDPFLRHWDKAQQEWERYPHRDLDYYEGQYLLHRQASVFEAGLQRRDEDAHLQASVEYLDLYYWTSRLKYSCELLNRANILHQASPTDLLRPIPAWLDVMPDAILRQPAVQAYLLTFQALQSPSDETRYQNWIDWLEANSQLFSPREAADMYNYAQNYCVRRINLGDSHYLQRLFTLFEQLVAKDLVLDQGFMDHRKLKNMVTVGIRLRAYDWVDNFLHSYRDKLMPAYQLDAYRFNLASLRYAQGRTSEALSLLQQVEFQDVFYHLSARSLLLKLYYETEEDVALEFLLETFRLYLHRNRAISAFQRQVHLNLLRFTRKLYRLRAQRGIISGEAFGQRLAKLYQNVSQAEAVANRSWLLAQLEALQKAFAENGEG